MTRLSTSLQCSLLALAAAVLLPSCESSKSTPGYDDVVDYTTPKTNLSKEEYPFDEEGNYLENYAARGAGVNGVQDKPNDPAMYEQPADDTPSRSTASTSTSYTPRKTTSSSSSRSSGSSSRSTASRSKPKPKPKPAPKASYVKVKSGDTLYALSKRYGVSVASIKSANGLSSDMIRDGKTLKIPAKKK